jgi:cyclopropane fatty-acyl-phospholipid synthase-like methyltransferase
MNEWWKTFFDQEYLGIWGQMFTEETDRKQAAELWSMLDLEPGCRILDAPCGWGRLSRRLAVVAVRED